MTKNRNFNLLSCKIYSVYANYYQFVSKVLQAYYYVNVDESLYTL